MKQYMNRSSNLSAYAESAKQKEKNNSLSLSSMTNRKIHLWLNTQEVQASLLTARMENRFQQAGNRDSLVNVQLVSTHVSKT